MDITLITAREAKNKTFLYLYLNESCGLWEAYGQSAFALRLYVKREGYDSLRSYSESLQMPYISVSHKTLNYLRGRLRIVDEVKDRQITFAVPQDIAFGYVDYLMWVDKLRKDNNGGKHQLEVKTLVSGKVPMGEFIPDGMSSFARNSKRIFDFMVATVTLIVFSP